MNKTTLISQQTFGEFFRLKRITLGFTLRSFCERYHFDPGNISRLERNILLPSVDEEKLEGYAEALKIAKGSSEWIQFFDFAYLAKGAIPHDLQNNQGVMSFLPAFYRTARGEKLDKKKVQKLIDILK